ncbi:MHC B-G antigen isoform X9 [Gallus gallus]|uniref:MHC B-G antigen isoform X9 n=1 Tax=Gallus gallus TaxID=9031 RepID=UPI001F019F29|nr:MHC B-G antigen isoform X9 [Gallus gallus]XP_046757401.1 MHC B-G antigen isoform X9 [Gallus gallus]
MGRLHRSPSASQSCFAAGFGCNSDPLRTIPRSQMAFTSGCNHPSFTLPWRTLLPYLVALHLLQPGSAQITVVAPSLRVTAIVGQDVVLRCHLSPCKDVRNSDIRWIQQRSSRLVHHYRNGVDLGQMEEYKGRTELLRDGLSDGNLDLRITAVTSSDSGSYSCAVQDGDAYAEAVVNLEVSDPFSMIILYWTVALAVIITLLVGSFVVNVFLHRKKVAQSRELKRKDAELVEKAAALERKDAELAEQAALSKQRDAMLEKHVLKLEEKTDEVENWNSVLKKDSEEMGYGFAELKKLAAELEKHSEEMGTRDLKLERLAAKLEHQTKELEKQHSQFQRHFQNMYLSAGKQKKMVTKLEEHCEWMVRRNVKLGESSSPTKEMWGLPWDQPWDDKLNLIMCFLFVPFAEAAAVKVGHKAKESEKQKSELKERHEEMAEQTEAVVVETEE